MIVTAATTMAHANRVGVNHNQLPVNAPRCPVHHYQRDAAMAGMATASQANRNQGGSVSFYPNDQAYEPTPHAEYATRVREALNTVG